MSTTNSSLIQAASRLRTFARVARTVLVPMGLAACAASTPKPARSDAFATATTRSSLPGAQDFDFLFGRWKVHHRILKPRADGVPAWVEAEGEVNELPIMGGLGNVEDFYMVREGVPLHAAALRAYDPKTHEWSIWWVDGRAPVSPIDPPVVGHFENGVGRFYAESDINGKPTKTRFIWSQESGSRARWEQALSTDGGKTWDTNWTMVFDRIVASDRP